MAYPLLCELAGTLVLAVAEELDDAALVGGETNWRKKLPSAFCCGFSSDWCNLPGNLLHDLANEGGALGKVSLPAGDLGLGITSGELVVSGVGAIGEPCKFRQSAIVVHVEFSKPVVRRIVRRQAVTDSGVFRT